jgi:hypothetical protein
MTTTRGGGEEFSRLNNNSGTLNALKARTSSIGRATAELKGRDMTHERNFRIARGKHGRALNAYVPP